MSGRRIVLNVLMAVALVTLLVFSYSYMNQPRFGYALYAVFPAKQLTTLTTL